MRALQIDTTKICSFNLIIEQRLILMLSVVVSL